MVNRASWGLASLAGAFVCATACGTILGLDGDPTVQDVGIDATTDSAGDAAMDVLRADDGNAEADTTGSADAPLDTSFDVPEAINGGDVGDVGDTGEASSFDGPSFDAPACGAGFVCIPAPPSGWSGPVQLFASSSPPPACSAPYPQQVFAGGNGLQASPAICQCGCDLDASTMGCGSTTVLFFGSGNNTCGGTPCDSTGVGGTCKTFNPSNCSGTKYTQIVPPGAFGGSCTAWVDASLPPTSWGIGALACAPSQSSDAGGCEAGAVCAPSPKAKLCIFEDGAGQPCPDGAPYSVPFTMYGAIDDTRGCQPCGCQPHGECGGYIVNYNNDLQCSSAQMAFGIPSACVQPYGSTGSLASGWIAHPNVVDASCTTSEGGATGSATETQPVTFCCVP